MGRKLLAAALLVSELGRPALAGNAAQLRLSPDAHAPFLHGVASADPLADAVLLWTRVAQTDSDGSAAAPVAEVTWAVWDEAAGGSFEAPAQTGVAAVLAENDFTVTVDAVGLSAGTRYWYQFEANATGSLRSRVGRTRTASATATSVSVAVLSCTSIWSGFFNLYRSIAEDDSLDFVLHLGDYVYPQVDPQEVRRMPFGLCDYEWFKGAAAKALQAVPATANEDTFVAGFVPQLLCAGGESAAEDLARYRWIHALTLLDPDLREARAAHPFVVSLDNHDINGRSALLAGSRQAAMEWVPQRHVLEPAGTGVRVNAQRELTFGADSLVHFISLDTLTGSPSLALEGMLGDAQHDWLETVLQNSSAAGAQWRLFGQAKQFMPFAVNDVHVVLYVYLAVALVLAVAAVGCCVGHSQAGLSRHERQHVAHVTESEGESECEGADDAKLDDRDAAEVSGDSGDCGPPSLSRQGSPACRSMARSLRRLRRAHRRGPGALRACTWLGVVVVVAIVVMWAMLACLVRPLFVANELIYLDGGKGSWEGHPESRQLLFDQLLATGTEEGNVFAGGDMHMAVFADCVQFDPDTLDLLDYDPAGPGADRGLDGVQRYGVEMLPASGSRGNVDEKLLEVTGIEPESVLSKILVRQINAAVRRVNKHFVFYEGATHGYGKVAFTPELVSAEYRTFPIHTVTNESFVRARLVMHKGLNKWELL